MYWGILDAALLSQAKGSVRFALCWGLMLRFLQVRAELQPTVLSRSAFVKEVIMISFHDTVCPASPISEGGLRPHSGCHLIAYAVSREDLHIMSVFGCYAGLHALAGLAASKCW